MARPAYLPGGALFRTSRSVRIAAVNTSQSHLLATMTLPIAIKLIAIAAPFAGAVTLPPFYALSGAGRKVKTHFPRG